MKAAVGIVLAVLAALGPRPAAGQVLNLSHDLVRLGIAAQDLAPNNPSLDAGPLIYAGTTYAFAHAIPLVTLDKGNYYLLSDQQANAVVILPRMSGLTLDFAGSTVFFRDSLLPNGIQLFQCNDFTLKNVELDFINPPYTHVQLTGVDRVGRTLSYATLPGWSDPTVFNSIVPFGTENNRWAAVFRNGHIVPGTTRMLLNQPIASGLLSLTQDNSPWTQAAALAALQPGDTVVVVARGGGAPILVWEGDNVTVANVTVHGAGEAAIAFFATTNSTADAIRVVPRPNAGLFGSVAGIAFMSTRQNNRIVNSYVSGTLDDAFAMDSHHVAFVASQTPPRQVTVTRDGYLPLPNGTAVNFVDPATTLESSTGAVIVAQNPPDWTQFYSPVDFTFDRDLPPLSPGMAVVYADPLNRGQGSIVSDNVAEDAYGGRGIWVTGLRGVTVERNTVRRTSMAGIILSTSTDPFDTIDIGPPNHDAVIRNNVVDEVLGPSAIGTGSQVGLGAIQVVSTDDQQFGFASSPGNTNISLTNNLVINSGRSGIWLGEVAGGLIQGNRLLGHNRHPELPIFGVPPPFVSQVLDDFRVPLVVRYSTGVTTQDNVIRTTGGLRDLSGDGRSDLVWRNTTTGATGLWLMNGTARSSGATLFSDPHWQVTHTADLNADGRTDLVWRNSATGQTAAWLMNGTTMVSGKILLNDPNWAVTHTGDFNGDGAVDLVWHNTATGATAIWLMSGLSYSAGAIVLVSPDWTVTHVADFNGDGKDDLLWRNTTTGQVAIWLMNGLTPASGAVVLADRNWAVMQAGDFNGDGRQDLLWRNSATGATAIWLMNGLAMLPSSGVILTSSNWMVTHVADFDGDGKDDLVWRNTATGQTALWLMNGASMAAGAILLSDPNWSVTHTGDYDGDGKADLIWRNAATGEIAMWLMNGIGMMGGVVELNDANWTVSPPSGL